MQSLLKRDLNYWKIAWYKLKQEQGERDQWSIKSDNLIEIPPKKWKIALDPSHKPPALILNKANKSKKII